MGIYDSNKRIDEWEKLQRLDLAVREVQNRLDDIRKYKNYNNLLNYNITLEKFRSNIHREMDYILKNP